MNTTRLDIIRRVSGPFNPNTYILICKTTREAVVIDPGGPADLLLALTKGKNLTPVPGRYTGPDQGKNVYLHWIIQARYAGISRHSDSNGR